MKALIFALVLLPTLAAAHPHAEVEQQLGFSLGREQSELTWYIVPASDDAAHIFDHIDTDMNGLVSTEEAEAFSADLIAATALTANDMDVALVLIEVTVPTRTELVYGQALIAVIATAAVPLSIESDTIVTLEVGYGVFAPEWYIQPFFHEDISEHGAPNITREEGTITFHVPKIGS